MSHTRRLPLLTVFLLAAMLGACAPTAPPAQPTAPAAPPTAAPTTAPATTAAPAAAPTSPPAVPTLAPTAAPKPAAATPGARPVNEQAVADFYRGKTLRLIVGFGAGGGYDTYSRVIARYVGNYIPGTPTVIVENLVGAGGLVAATQVANALPKDGTVVGNFAINSVFEGIVNGQALDFDPSALHYLSMPSVDDIICLSTRASGFTSLEQTLGPNSRQMVIGSTGAVPTEVQVLRAALGANMREVTGYNGTAAVRLAMDQKEVDGQCQISWQSVATTAMDRIQSGDFVVMGQVVGDKLNKALPPTTPLAWQLAKTDETRQLLLYGMTLPRQFQRQYVMATAVPTDRVQAMRNAFDRVLQDKDLLAEAQKAQLDIAPRTGEEAEQYVQQLVNMPADVRAKLKELAAQKS